MKKIAFIFFVSLVNGTSLMATSLPMSSTRSDGSWQCPQCNYHTNQETDSCCQLCMHPCPTVSKMSDYSAKCGAKFWQCPECNYPTNQETDSGCQLCTYSCPTASKVSDTNSPSTEIDYDNDQSSASCLLVCPTCKEKSNLMICRKCKKVRQMPSAQPANQALNVTSDSKESKESKEMRHTVISQRPTTQSEWSCEDCSYTNPAKQWCCGMCGLPRPVPVDGGNNSNGQKQEESE